MSEEQREEERVEEDPPVDPEDDATTSDVGAGEDQGESREEASGSAEPDLEPEGVLGGDQLQRGVSGGDDQNLPGGEHAGDQQGQGLQLAMNPPIPPGHEGEIPNYRAWITPMGTRYHVTTLCVTLHNTNRIFQSPWCPLCGHRRRDQRYSSIYVDRVGGEAHHDHPYGPTISNKLSMLPTMSTIQPGLPWTMGRSAMIYNFENGLGYAMGWKTSEAVSQGGVQIAESFMKTYP